MTHLVIKRDELIYSNAIARTKDWPRHLKKHEFEDVTKFDKDQEWPIHFSMKDAAKGWQYYEISNVLNFLYLT